jgi:hypothetical protein
MSQCPVISWTPLGELLVERGLLSMDELDDALAEQVATGERLGAILVARKAVASPVLTMLLAEQAGVPLETQGGFGSGLFSKIAERHGPDGAPAENSSRAAVEPEDGGSWSEVAAELADPAYELSALRAELDMLRARNAELEAKLAKPARRRSSKSAA